MNELGQHLKQLRAERGRSRLWVERQSRQRYPDSRERHISHSYLRQMEEGLRKRPSPLKLLTLAEIYETDYGKLMVVAGYIDRSIIPTANRQLPVGGDRDSVTVAREWLETNGIHFDYFMRALAGLSKESLALVSRMVTNWNIKEQAPHNTPGEQEQTISTTSFNKTEKGG